MKKNCKVVLTGGGTAGHVIPHIALLPTYKAEGWDILYIGSKGIEREVVRRNSIPFKTISAGKLRRYISGKNIIDAVKVAIGVAQAFFYLLRYRPNLIFSKGGYVCVPVAIAGWLLRIPVVTHESDLSPGLATRIVSRFAYSILYSFPDTVKMLPKKKAVFTGAPTRAELTLGEPEKGLKLCGFCSTNQRPILLIMGGSLGAKRINEALLGALNRILQNFRVIHICGKGKNLDIQHDGYKQFSYVDEDLRHIFAITEAVVCRSGAGSIFEFLELGIPMLLVPLSQGSRGDQVENAQAFLRKGWAMVLSERELTPNSLIESIDKLWSQRQQISRLQKEAFQGANPKESIIIALKEAIKL